MKQDKIFTDHDGTHAQLHQHRNRRRPLLRLVAGMLLIITQVFAMQSCATNRDVNASDAGGGIWRFNFDDEQVGGLPAGWRIDATKAGRGGDGAAHASWRIMRADNAPSPPNVLAVVEPNHGENQTFNLCWTDAVRFLDGRILLRFTCVSGMVDQGGGPIWRVQDRDNYYICRANPLENNFRVYKVINGVRTQLGSAPVQMTADPHGGWHTIEVEHTGDRIVCTLDSTVRLEVTDSAIPNNGGVGVWSKADAAVHFDNLHIDATPRAD
jgi:hypothetical protein